MSEPIAVVVPKDLYYHEIDYVRGLEARVAKLEAALRRCRQGWHNLEELYGVDPDAAIAEIDAALSETVEA